MVSQSYERKKHSRPFCAGSAEILQCAKAVGGRLPNKRGVKIVQPSKKESDGQKKGKKG